MVDWSTAVLPIHAAASSGTQAITMISAEPRSLPIASMTPFTSGRPPRPPNAARSFGVRSRARTSSRAPKIPAHAITPPMISSPIATMPPMVTVASAPAPVERTATRQSTMASGVSPPASNSTENTNASTAKPAE